MSRAWLAALLLLAAASPSAAAAPVSFSRPEQVAGGHALNAVSCGRVGACVAVGDAGQVVWSEAPASGAAAWGIKVVDGSNRLTHVACAGRVLCVAADQLSRVLSSTDPIGSASTWSTPALIDPGHLLKDLSCPSIQLCVAVDDGGGVLSSTHPDGGASGWKRTQVSKHGLSRISCPARKLCVLTDASNRLFVSTNPAGGRAAWRAHAALPRHYRISAISCALYPQEICVLLAVHNGFRLDAFASTTPANPNRWHHQARGLDYASHTAFSYELLSCATAHLCVGADGTDGPTVLESTQPLAARWRGAGFPGSNSYQRQLTGVSCATSGAAGECVITTSDGSVIVGF